MKTCAKCGQKFKTFAIIDGQKKILGSRKYCLECSPFAKHNTSQLEKAKATDGNGRNVCGNCQRTFFYKRRSGHGRNICNSCRTHNKSVRRKQKAIEYKGGRCEFCGYCKYYGALTFHHLDPNAKEFAIAGNHNRAWELVRSELDKCKLLCMNCHAEEHERLRSVR